MANATPSEGGVAGRGSSGSLRELINARAGYASIASYLDGLPYEARLAEVLSITGKAVGALYDAVSGAPPIGISELGLAREGETVIFEGRNSLPLFSRFQKRFCAGAGGSVVGYNHGSTAFAVGPGFFVTSPPDETHPGELLFDYTLPPPFVPGGWPAYVPNERGLSRAVFANMKDYCRRVATGVLVGSAFKKGVAQNAWFSLTRQAP